MTDKYLDKTAGLMPAAKQIICERSTEAPYSGIYKTVAQNGSYLCRRCGIVLFRGKHQFYSGSGWPSFDKQVADHVTQQLDADGQRTEIICSRCHAHLGHVFTGEQMTPENLRYCVNSLSLDFVNDGNVLDTEEALVAGGCFWGIDYFFNQLPEVVKTEVGYSGGELENPSYESVCRGDSGHYETVRVLYDRSLTDYQQIIQYFFEIHDPTQRTGQGPDIGHQYQSVIFYYDVHQKNVAEYWIQRLQKNGLDVATSLLPAQTFWPAEDYHQDYYFKNNKKPYCHQRVKRF